MQVELDIKIMTAFSYDTLKRGNFSKTYIFCY